jgi:O-antigen/teichoic acid export membrane protein
MISRVAEPRPIAPLAAAPQSGARSTALLAGASAAGIFAAYVFLLAAGRLLGSEDYGSLAALLGLLAIVVLPTGALQMAVSREFSRRRASGDERGAARLASGTLRVSLIATAPLLVVMLALAQPLSRLLHIDSVGIVVLAVLSLSTALAFPVAMGVLQGEQRFSALASLYIVPWLVRLVVLAIAAAAGYRLGGAVFAVFAGAIGSMVPAYLLIREPLRGSERLPRPELLTFLRYLWPVAVGLIGIALLTNVDVLIVKARVSADSAGAYAAASAFARVGFFLPAAILTVLFPRTAARQARGEETEDILGRSLLATAAFCGLLALVYAAAGTGLVVLTFGRDFAEGGGVVAPFAVAMGLYSLANVLVGYHLSRGEVRYAWIVAASVVAQVAALSLVPADLHTIVWTNVVIGVALLAAHELLVSSSVPAIRAGVRHLQPSATVRARARAIALEGLAVLGVATAFVCALFWPVVRHLGSTIIGSPGSDSTGGVAWLWALQREGGYHILGTVHHTMTGAPFGWDQTNAVNVQYLLPYYPAYLATKLFGPIVALNLCTFAGYILSGVSMYALVRYIGLGRLVAAWAALAIIVFPYHFAHEEHASLLHLEVLVLLLIALVALARNPTWIRFALVAAANLACWLTSGYFGAVAFVVTIFFTLGAALVADRRHALRLVAGAAGGAIVSTALLAVAAVASGTNAGAGLGRQVGDLSIFGIRPLELFVPPNGNIVLDDRLASYWSTRFHGSNQTEMTTYLGLLTWTLAIGWLVAAWQRRAQLGRETKLVTAGLVTSFAAALLFAAPSPIRVLGHSVPMPSRLMWAVVPAFRVVSRWDFFLMTALVPLAAFGLDALVRALSRRWRSTAVAAVIVGVAMVFSFFELTIHPARPRFRTVPVPAEFAAAKKAPPGIVADYPLGYSDIFRLWQRVHGRPLVNGAPAGTDADYARMMVLDPNQPGTAEALAALGVTAVGIHPEVHVDAEVQPQPPAGNPGYRLISRYPDGASVWQVTAKPAPAFVTLPGGFGVPRRLADGRVGWPLSGSGGVGVLELRARKAGTVLLTFDVLPPKAGSWNLRVADPQREQPFTLTGPTTVTVNVAVPRGVSRLLLKVDPAPTSEADALMIVMPRTAPGTGAATLHAEKLSDKPGL